MIEVALVEPWMKAAKTKKKTKKIEEQGLYIGKENKRKQRKEIKPEIAIKLPEIGMSHRLALIGLCIFTFLFSFNLAFIAM